MWSRNRSALFIDFENVATKASPDAIAALLAWLEDGKFDEAGGRRKLVHKRIYWNSSAEKHRNLFEDAGFEVMLCEKFSNLKNGADIRMALDILDTCWKVPEVNEYILFTTDSDFVPVLQRLTEKSKTSAILVNEARMQTHSAFSIYADIIVPVRQLSDAFAYRRQPKRFLGAIRKLADPRPSRTSAPRNGSGSTTAGKAASSGTPNVLPSVLDQAERAVVRVTSRTPGKFAPRKDIENQLRQIKGFRKTGANAYFGRKHYQGLMIEIGHKNAQIKVSPGRSESASVMYVPPE